MIPRHNGKWLYIPKISERVNESNTKTRQPSSNAEAPHQQPSPFKATGFSFLRSEQENSTRLSPWAPADWK